mmetsp:Transcript_42943/g.77148  ORF Transcript_42943/g.77148 Transcript_42943/m.77148 type:complete len:144 (-) Transcript_42943:675-1106(-)
MHQIPLKTTTTLAVYNASSRPVLTECYSRQTSRTRGCKAPGIPPEYSLKKTFADPVMVRPRYGTQAHQPPFMMSHFNATPATLKPNPPTAGLSYSAKTARGRSPYWRNSSSPRYGVKMTPRLGPSYRDMYACPGRLPVEVYFR